MRRVLDLMDLRGRVALITGGGGHIGAAIAETLAEVGASIALIDIESAHPNSLAARLKEEYGVATLPLVADLGDERSVRAAPAQVANELGSLDILIHCAAWAGASQLKGWAVPFAEQTVEAWEMAHRVNVTAAFVLVQEAQALLAASGHGSVILMASIYGLVGPDMRLYEGTDMANPAGYNSSKGALLQLTRYLATLLAPRVRVNAISPGGVWRHQPDSFHKRYTSRAPLQRMATEDDFKGAALFLASDLSAYVTGHNLVVDGGWTAW
jgi:NAD(P)-dependent dehydrogenase (short-subunit alcohol dehydrogenase family)